MNNIYGSSSLDHPSHRGLLKMVGLAAVLHLLGLCLFKVVAPLTQPSRVTSATFYVLPADSLNSASFYTWLEAEDPALFTQTTTPAAAANIPFPDILYVPSYEAKMKNRQLSTDPLP